MGGHSEREYREKLNKITEKLTKREKDVRKDFAKIEKMKVDALKKSEEMRRSVQHDLDKIEKNIANSKDLAPESKKRLRSEILVLRNAIRQEYTELKTQISKTLIPA
jgi:gas vesicle protein